MKKSFREINKQLNKEALYTVILYGLFFLWWYGTAYGLQDSTLRIMGLPAWFFLSCIGGWLLCCIGVTILVKKFFKPVDFTQFEQDENPPKTNPDTPKEEL